MTTILGITGSQRQGSLTRQMVTSTLQGAKKAGATIDHIDLANYKTLPYCDGRDNTPDSYGKDVMALVKKVAQADGFVIGTPEYHGGYSGVLKNFLDLMPRDVFENKFVGLVGASGGKLGAEGAMNQLRIVFKNLNAFCMPHQVSATYNDTTNGQLNAAGQTGQKLPALGAALVQTVRKMMP